MLTDMARRIERQSSLEYRSLTAAMLNDLVDMEGRDFDRNKKYDTPSKEDLESFLNRVNSNNIYATGARLMAPSAENTTLIDNLRKVYRKSSDGISGYLGYFLSKLNAVIEETKETELKIESFVNICNKYLGMAGDSKNLQFNATNFKVTVKDEFANEEIALDDLSSGEKQVISLMAMLYLWDEQNKIVLIDEPELSLSLTWQQNLLPDVNDAPLVGQVVAITHSPFIFDNDLDKNSASLKIKKNKYNGDAKNEQ